jgi:hypothetical protein
MIIYKCQLELPARSSVNSGIAKPAAAIFNRLPLTQNKSTLPFNIE